MARIPAGFDEDEDVLKNVKRVVKYVAWGVLGLILIIALFSTFYIVNAGERAVVLTWGNPSPVAVAEGLHLKIPFAQTVVKMNVKTQKYEADASSASKDLQIVHTKVAVNFHITPETVPTLYKEIGVNYQDVIIQPAVQESVKASTAQFTAEELITKRDILKSLIDEKLHERLFARGINMETTNLVDFDFSEEFNKAIETKVTAEQNALAEKNRLEQVKYQAQQAIENARGSAESVKLKADAEAYSLRVIREQLEKNNVLIQYKQIEKWNGNLPQFMLGGSSNILLNVPIINSTG